MRLPGKLHQRVLSLLHRTGELRSGETNEDPRWLQSIEAALRDAQSDLMRTFFELYFVRNLPCLEIQYQLFVERSTLFMWRNFFLWCTALEAAKRGLI